MILKIGALILLLGAIKMLYSSVAKNVISVETPIDQAWWEGLSEEWKTILLINQNFSKQHTDIYAVQNGYINRMNAKGQDDHYEMNTSLHNLNNERDFKLSYDDFYTRALKYKFVTANQHIDLATLGNLDIIYMVNGPGDLNPLKKFPNLKILVLNSCGIDLANAIRSPALNLEPIRNLKKLQVLECSAHLLHSIEPIENLTSLRELRIESSKVTDLSPLKKLVNLEKLSVRTNAKSASAISDLIALKVLHLDGVKKILNLSKLKNLKNLLICEDELAITDGSYRIKSIDFLSSLQNLEYLDLEYTSYRGDLSQLDGLQNLKAITLPDISRSDMSAFKDHHRDCIIINAYRYE
ncbi:MAG: hypothetical protein ABI002_00080 [Saprospiraceae bacterium]